MGPDSSLRISSEDIPIKMDDKVHADKTAAAPELDKDKHPTKSHKSCIPCSADRPCLTLLADRINTRAQKMKDHALIGKFMGFWPTEYALRGWIAAKWKPKAHFDLQLGSKGFFTIIFHHLEDKA